MEWAHSVKARLLRGAQARARIAATTEFPDGQAIADLNVGGGQNGIDAGGEVEFDGQTVQGGDGSGADGGELKGDRMLLLVELRDIVDAAEMGEDAEGGFAVLAKGLDDAVVVDAVGLISLK